MFSTTDNGQAESVVHYVLWGRGEGGGGEGSGVLVFWGDHISHGFQGERGGGWGVGGQSSPIKCIEGTIKNSQPIGSGGGGHKNIGRSVYRGTIKIIKMTEKN